MLSKPERRFLRYWEDERSDGKITYILQYTLVGTFLTSLLLSVFLLLFFNIYYASPSFWLVPVSALVLSILYAVASWSQNEKKWRRLIRREVEYHKTIRDQQA